MKNDQEFFLAFWPKGPTTHRKLAGSIVITLEKFNNAKKAASWKDQLMLKTASPTGK